MTEIEQVYEAMKKVLYKKYDIDPMEVVLVGEPEVKERFTEVQMWYPDFPEPFITMNNSKMLLKYWDKDELDWFEDCYGDYCEED